MWADGNISLLDRNDKKINGFHKRNNKEGRKDNEKTSGRNGTRL